MHTATDRKWIGLIDRLWRRRIAGIAAYWDVEW